jgi:hypothetical protein
MNMKRMIAVVAGAVALAVPSVAQAHYPDLGTVVGLARDSPTIQADCWAPYGAYGNCASYPDVISGQSVGSHSIDVYVYYTQWGPFGSMHQFHSVMRYDHNYNNTYIGKFW